MSNLIRKKKKRPIPNSKKSPRAKVYKKSVITQKDIATDQIGETLPARMDAELQQAIGALVDLRKELSQIEARYRSSLYDFLARAYGLAQGLRMSPSTSRFFWNSDQWGDRSQYSGKNARCPLYVVLRFLCPEGIEGSKTASFYHRALNSQFKERVPAEEIVETIKTMGGLRKMAAEAAKGDHSSEPVVASSPKKSARTALEYEKRANICCIWDGAESNQKGLFQGLVVGDEFQLTGVIESLQNSIALRVKSLSKA